MNKNYLLLCELYHPNLHGYDITQSDPNIYGHYIIIHIDDNSDDDSDDDYYDDYSDSDSENDFYILNEVMMNVYRNKYKLLTDSYRKNNLELTHKVIRNYFNIISKENYITPQIGYKVYLSGNECVAILKTFWIRIVQRCWKRVYRNRCKLMKNMVHLLNKRSREYGYHINVPGLYGMYWSS